MTAIEGNNDPRRTRPGTPMIGEYSTNEMDDFYGALAMGQVKLTGIMNYLQKLFITERCNPGDRVVDVCCGSGLQLPVFYRYRPDLGTYFGLDISAANLRSAVQRQDVLDNHYGAQFPITFLRQDVAQPWGLGAAFDVAIYTSALEHLPRELGIASLRNTANALAPTGRLYLSTPNTPGIPPRELQHRVHVYEWSHDELIGVLGEVGFMVEDVVGILAPAPERVERELADRFGPGAGQLYHHLHQSVPVQLLSPVIATALAEAATETLCVCSRKPE